jgi:capsule polysaccharide export protein KpsC/LpsZ
VTVCSQAGLEALMMGKEAVLLGDAYYGGLGFTHDVQDRTQIGPAIATALSTSGRRLDPDRVARFFYVLDRLYCVEKSERGLRDVLLRTLGRAPLATI